MQCSRSRARGPSATPTPVCLGLKTLSLYSFAEVSAFGFNTYFHILLALLLYLHRPRNRPAPLFVRRHRSFSAWLVKYKHVSNNASKVFRFNVNRNILSPLSACAAGTAVAHVPNPFFLIHPLLREVERLEHEVVQLGVPVVLVNHRHAGHWHLDALQGVKSQKKKKTKNSFKKDLQNSLVRERNANTISIHSNRHAAGPCTIVSHTARGFNVDVKRRTDGVKGGGWVHRPDGITSTG